MFKCRLCNSQEVASIIPLGNLPLANALLSSKTSEPETCCNLEVMLCHNCNLAQLRDLIDPTQLFSDYVYFSSNSDEMLTSARLLTERIIQQFNQDKPFVVEIASNDGYLLKNYVGAGIDVLGIDPAENIARLANENGIPTQCCFFGEEIAHQLAHQGQQADIIHANNVMAHVPDINGFIKGIKTLLKDDGQAIIEVPYFLELIKKLEFDTIYHEHVYYFSVLSLKFAFTQHDLTIHDIEQLSLHGGSLRLFVSHTGKRSVASIVDNLIQEETFFGLKGLKIYEIFTKELGILRSLLTKTLTDLKISGAKIAAYGASAKGTTLLNYFQIDSTLIDFVVDRSVAKQGKYTPGTQLEIFAPQALIDNKITHALLLTWNFEKEILVQQQEFINRGGQFIIPLPEVAVKP